MFFESTAYSCEDTVVLGKGTMRRVHKTSLAFFALGICTVCALALIHVGRALETKVNATTIVQGPMFTWSMQQRFGAKRADGIVDYHWDGSVYEKDYVNPKGWKVEFLGQKRSYLKSRPVILLLRQSHVDSTHVEPSIEYPTKFFDERYLFMRLNEMSK